MKIRKNGKVVNLTEGDLRRITKKVLKESSYSDMVEEEGDVDLPDECPKSHMKKVMTAMSEPNNLKVKIETGVSFGVDSNFGKTILVITDPDGGVCGCLKKDFFAGGI